MQYFARKVKVNEMPKSLRNAPLYLAYGIYAENMNSVIDKLHDNTQLCPITINDKILIYERQVKSWFLDVAFKLFEEDGEKNEGKSEDETFYTNSFVALMIGISYIEGVQQYKEGRSSRNRGNKVCFRRGFREIFENVNTTTNNEQLTNNQIDAFYSSARCGLFHNGMTGGNIVLRYDCGSPIFFEGIDLIRVNPWLFLEYIKSDFERYIEILNDESNEEAREKFSGLFSLD